MLDIVPTFDLYGERAARASDFWLHCETVAARSRLHGWEISPHRHGAFAQMLHLEAGAAEAVLGAGWETVPLPAVVVVPVGLEHGFRFSPDIEGRVITLLPSRLHGIWRDQARFRAWLCAPHVISLTGDEEDGRYAALTLRRLWQEYEARRPGRDDLLQAHLVSVIALLARLSACASEAAMTVNDRRMERLAALLRQHLRQHKPASFYAAALGVSPTHLNRIVQAATGGSVQKMITGVLLEEVKHELVFGYGTVQDVALRLGFEDPAYFSRFFVRHVGVTPRAWRRAEQAATVIGRSVE